MYSTKFLRLHHHRYGLLRTFQQLPSRPYSCRDHHFQLVYDKMCRQSQSEWIKMISPLICVHTTMTDCFPLKNQMCLCLAGVPATCNPNSDYRQSLQLHWWIVSRPPRSISWKFLMNSTEITSHPFTPLLFVLTICVHYLCSLFSNLCSLFVFVFMFTRVLPLTPATTTQTNYKQNTVLTDSNTQR